MPRECLPEHLRDKRHNDWPWPLSLISRNVTAFCGEPPTLIEGTTMDPVPQPGNWTRQRANLAEGTPAWVPRHYYAITYENGVHHSDGCRWDTNDRYYNWPRLALKVVETWDCATCGQMIWDPIAHRDAIHGGEGQPMRSVPWYTVLWRLMK